MNKKLKIQCHGHVINYLNGEEINRTFHEKELQKKNLEFNKKK